MEEFGGHSHNHTGKPDEEQGGTHDHVHAHDHGHSHTQTHENGKNGDMKWQKFGMLILGIAVMTLLSIFGEHSHGGGHKDEHVGHVHSHGHAD